MGSMPVSFEHLLLLILGQLNFFFGGGGIRGRPQRKKQTYVSILSVCTLLCKALVHNFFLHPAVAFGRELPSLVLICDFLFMI